MDLRARDPSYKRQPALIHQKMVFATELATIGWVRAGMFTASRRRHTGSVNAGSIPYDPVMLTKAPQNHFMDTLPNACLHPLMKATPARHATAAAEFAREVFPRYPGLEYEQGPG
jgi:hypothetical protein